MDIVIHEVVKHEIKNEDDLLRLKDKIDEFHWGRILRQDPTMIKHCNCVKNIWVYELLLVILDYPEALEYLNKEQLKDLEWARILQKHPQAVSYMKGLKLQYWTHIIPIVEICDVKTIHEVFNCCNIDSLKEADRWIWCKLIRTVPEIIKYCDIESFNANDRRSIKNVYNYALKKQKGVLK